MIPDLTIVFAGLVLLQVKHFIADFVVQTPYQWRNKGRYGHPGGLLHAGIHAVGTIPALLVFGAPPILLAEIIAAEFLVHYHIDWTKEGINRRYGLNDADTAYWIVLGADQMLHQLTYLVIAAIAVGARAAVIA